MLQIITPEDEQEDDTELQKNTRALTQEDIDLDDKEFAVQEVTNVVLSMFEIKAPGEEGILIEFFKIVEVILTRCTIAVYNSCHLKGKIPRRWKKALVIPITKPGKT